MRKTIWRGVSGGSVVRTFGRPVLHPTRRFVVSLCLFFAGLPAVQPLQCGVDSFQYQMPMAAAPAVTAEAIATIPDRKRDVIRALACGSELTFAAMFQDSKKGEDIAAFVLGKAAWLQQRPVIATTNLPPLPPCEFTGDIHTDQICRWFDSKCMSDDKATRDGAAAAFLNEPVWKALNTNTLPLRAQLITTLPPACADGATQQISITGATGASPDSVTLTFQLSAACIGAEIDAAIMRIDRGELQAGSDGLPCHYTSSTHGDWDSTLKTLIRVAELDRRQPVLGTDARKRLNDTLLDIDGGPAQERYHLWECGNEEQSVGDPKTRSEERDGVSGILDDIWDSGWDILWFLLTLLVIYLALVAAAFYALGSAVAAAVATAVAVAVAAAALITFPETENHLWMINSTKYLNNQYIIANGGTGYGDDQSDLREWILNQTQKVLQNDFIEYNSRPYARYSLVSLTNLAEFATDPAVRTAARAVLEYSIAKYAVTSNEGRRIPPFRRKREDMLRVDGKPRDGTTDEAANGLFDLIQGSDHLHAVGLYFFGNSLNLLSYRGSSYAATTAGYPAHAIYYATSGYRPDDAIFALAMERAGSPMVHQQLHHYGWEIVSSGASFTITAGGHTTGIAKGVTIAPIDGLIKPDDLGAAVPTTLMVAGAPDVPPGLNDPNFPRPAVPRAEGTRRSTLDRFLRFEGKRPPAVESTPTYDRNLCVWDGFACGVNPGIPADMAAPCMTTDPRFGWHFIRSDSADCPGYNRGPAFWIALFYKTGAAVNKSGWGSVDGYGFFEIVDGSEMSFEEFKTRVLQRNPGPDDPMHLSGNCGGAYVSARGAAGQRIEFTCERITKVGGTQQPSLDDWNFAGSPPGALGTAPIQSAGDGYIEITSVAAKRKVVLNLKRAVDPRFDTVSLP